MRVVPETEREAKMEEMRDRAKFGGAIKTL
ncbi:hypothetical protein CCACVL1_15227 [Corchorus capsularis]|uniref:Uncharacterized protein n=1 Tax=Corchorus capsularis TaxID=210143 RepID=A0A1R3I370_COCAP|nr:hypothetical protein CCACVL1_15227 [Corchorus capsularis]